MPKPVGPVQLRALQPSRNGRSSRRPRATRASVHLVNGRPPTWTFPGLRILRRIRRALGEIVVMAVVLALSIVLAHVLLIVMFPV